MTDHIVECLESLGYLIDDAPTPSGLYSPITAIPPIVYVSGAVPVTEGHLKYAGKVPSDVDLPTAQKAAALCVANNLRMFYQEYDSLESIARVLRLTGYVNSDPHFTDQHLVMNGASQLLREVFGKSGVGARSAVGVAQLPLGSTVETELILEIVAS